MIDRPVGIFSRLALSLCVMKDFPKLAEDER